MIMLCEIFLVIQFLAENSHLTFGENNNNVMRVQLGLKALLKNQVMYFLIYVINTLYIFFLKLCTILIVLVENT